MRGTRAEGATTQSALRRFKTAKPQSWALTMGPFTSDLARAVRHPCVSLPASGSLDYHLHTGCTRRSASENATCTWLAHYLHPMPGFKIQWALKPVGVRVPPSAVTPSGCEPPICIRGQFCRRACSSRRGGRVGKPGGGLARTRRKHQRGSAGRSGLTSGPHHPLDARAPLGHLRVPGRADRVG